MTKSQKHREAALKAWETIRKNQREKAAENVKILDNWISASEINEIKHPEEIDIQFDSNWQGNGVIKLFNKTPSDIACGPFWEIRWAYGCPLDCSYCYLRGTMRGNMKQSYVRFKEIKRCVEEAFQKIITPQIFNSGELCDSLMNPELMNQIVDLFETQNKHKIFLLSKYGINNIGFLLEKVRKQTICAWSINAKKVAEQWERNAAKPLERIEAAKLVWEEGYDTRVRIDPIFPIPNWQEDYTDLLDNIFSSFLPNRIILGTPRGLWKTINYAKKADKDMTWTNFFKEDTGWGKKLSFDDRFEIYSFFYKKLDSYGYPLHKVSICKETLPIWKALGQAYSTLTCNCYGPKAYNP
ncbi:hypothetical protein JXL21_06915 [Candidatus Bathyarchaeota archaeon]|nr:hypothetical protein [Candidatus Bathyarchaeota archaeon]